MFIKLLKHEWKSNSKLLLTMSAFMLGIALLGGLDLRLIINTVNSEAESDLMALVLIPAFLFLIILFLAVSIYAAGVQIYLLYRFYKSRFTDEGYLTFTLPVKTSHIFLSTALHILIWMIICVVVLIICGCIFIFAGVPLAVTGYANYGEFLVESTKEFQMIFEVIPFENYLITLPVSLISGILLPMSAIVVGAVVAKKLKILAAIGIMYGCSALNGVISGMISAVTTVMSLQGVMDLAAVEQNLPLVLCIAPALLAGFGYALSIYLMKNKLNLP